MHTWKNKSISEGGYRKFTLFLLPFHVSSNLGDKTCGGSIKSSSFFPKPEMGRAPRENPSIYDKPSSPTNPLPITMYDTSTNFHESRMRFRIISGLRIWGKSELGERSSTDLLNGKLLDFCGIIVATSLVNDPRNRDPRFSSFAKKVFFFLKRSRIELGGEWIVYTG